MTRSPLLHRYWIIYRKKPALCVSFQFYYPILCNFKFKLYFYFHHAAANNSSTTTVSPDYQNGQSPLEQPNGNDVSADDDDDGNSSEANAAVVHQDNQQGADDPVSLPVVGESSTDTTSTPRKLDESSGTSEEEDEPVVEPVDNTSGAPTSQSKNDTNKKRRRKRKTSNPLESVCCRGICGFASNCVSQKSPSITEQDEIVPLLHCLNFNTDLQCPLWVGQACALKYDNFMCRICALLDGKQEGEISR